MKHVKKSVLLWYSPHEIYELVTGFERYAEFLPWCERAEVLERHEDGQESVIVGRLSLSIAGVRQSFTTRNTNTPDSRVHMELVEGPFSQLDGVWTFSPLNKPGTDPASPPQACKVEFELSYAFSNRALEAVISPVFDKVANTFVDCFVQRAAVVYGQR